MDIVICHGPNDDNILDLNLKHNKKNIIHRNIYIITYDSNLKRDDCIIIHESALPFKDKISEMFPNEKETWLVFSTVDQIICKRYNIRFIRILFNN